MKTVLMLTALLLSCTNNPISNLNTAINGVEDDDELTLRLLFDEEEESCEKLSIICAHEKIAIAENAVR